MHQRSERLVRTIFPLQGTARPPPAAKQQPAALLDLDQGVNMGLPPGVAGQRFW